jgi:hypothetical protein
MLRRNEQLDWLKAPLDPDTCRILSNARCLSEGVDVPALDAVMFLNPEGKVVKFRAEATLPSRRRSGFFATSCGSRRVTESGACQQ